MNMCLSCELIRVARIESHQFKVASERKAISIGRADVLSPELRVRE
jgi:hypothetical protein